MIYYGTEAGMWGADDPCDRMPMVWRDMKYDPQTHDPLGRPRKEDSVKFDRKLYGFYEAAIHLRRAYAALRQGEIEFTHTDNDNSFLAYRRWDDKYTLWIGINRGEDDYQWELDLEPGQSVRQIFTASGEVKKHKLKKQKQGAMVSIPALDGVVLRVSGR